MPLVLATCLSLVGRRASAGSAEDEARKLFEDGIAAEKAGRSADACTKFRQSLGLVREVGPLAKVKSCDLRESKLLSGEANLQELISRWPQPGPELDALKAELAVVQKRIPHLTLRLRSGAPVGIAVRLDGGAVDFPVENRAVDPGKHELLVDVPGRPLERVAMELKDGERKTIEVPAAAEPAVKPPPPVPQSALGALGITGIVVAAVGVGGFVGAGVTGGLVLDKQEAFETNGCPPDDGVAPGAGCGDLASEGDTLLVANGVLWGVGIAGVVVGATLLVVDLTTGSSEPAAATLRVGPRWVGLDLRF